MNRRDAMLDRLPPIYRIEPPSLLWQWVALVGNALAAFDEDLDRVQRSHWLATAFDREDLAKLGRLVGLTMAPWEPEDLFRRRLVATVAARLEGAVTRSAIEGAIVRILSGALEAMGLRYFDPGRNRAFRTGPAERPGEPAWIEFPSVTRRCEALISRNGLLRALDQVVVTHRGLHPSPVRCVIRGLAGSMTLVPLIANLTNGSVLVYRGEILCGQELRIGSDAEGRVTARLGGRDVSGEIFTGTGFQPGATFSPILPDPTPEPLRLERGANRLWFFPLALYDAPSLGSAVLGMPVPEVTHGQFGARGGTGPEGTRFDRSLFEQPPFVSIDLWWDEAQPAAFRCEIPAGAVLARADAAGDGTRQHERLFVLLQETVDLLRGVGVDGRIEARPLREIQRQEDRVRMVPPLVARESMTVEARLRALSAVFDSSAVEGSRFA